MRNMFALLRKIDGECDKEKLKKMEHLMYGTGTISRFTAGLPIVKQMYLRAANLIVCEFKNKFGILNRLSFHKIKFSKQKNKNFWNIKGNAPFL